MQFFISELVFGLTLFHIWYLNCYWDDPSWIWTRYTELYRIMIHFSCALELTWRIITFYCSNVCIMFMLRLQILLMFSDVHIRVCKRVLFWNKIFTMHLILSYFPSYLFTRFVLSVLVSCIIPSSLITKCGFTCILVYLFMIWENWKPFQLWGWGKCSS